MGCHSGMLLETAAAMLQLSRMTPLNGLPIHMVTVSHFPTFIWCVCGQIMFEEFVAAQGLHAEFLPDYV